MGELTFTAELVSRGPGTAVILTDEQVAAVGEGPKRVPVAATINGYTWRSTVVRMRGEFMLGLSRENREGAGVQSGDTVEVELRLDTAAREVDVPPALAEALKRDLEAADAFGKLAYTHRKEFARWIEEAKREETRARRVEQALTMLREGRTRS
jgi:Bacteriocin-protection, YdeI or OmpD-Associated/Domain of unknown function (DUF1905)